MSFKWFDCYAWHNFFLWVLSCDTESANKFGLLLLQSNPFIFLFCLVFILVNEQSQLHCGATSLSSLSSLEYGLQPLAMLCLLKLCTQLQILQIRFSFLSYCSWLCSIEYSHFWFVTLNLTQFYLSSDAEKLICVRFLGTSCLWSE